MGHPGGKLKRDAMDCVTNAFDEYAIEEALLTRKTMMERLLQ